MPPKVPVTLRFAIVVLVFGLMISAPVTNLHATDPRREAEVAGDMGSRYDGEETVWLDAAGTRFAALLRESVNKPIGGVLILHGIEESPDAPNLVQILRKALPKKGWSSLSLQAPVREAGADLQRYEGLAAEAVGRIQAGIKFLSGKQIAPVAIIGHRGGALAAIRFTAQSPDVKAAVLINMPDEADEETAQAMAKIKVPVLDIIAGGRMGHEDATTRRKGLMKQNDRYQQMVIADTGSNLGDVDGMLVNRIHGWLKRMIAP